MKRRRGKRRTSDVAKLVDELGAVTVAYRAGVSATAVYRWLAAGRIRDAAPLLQLAAAVGVPVDPRLRALAGLRD